MRNIAIYLNSNKEYKKLIYIFILFTYSEPKNTKLSLNNNDSLIKIQFKSKGRNRYLSNSFNLRPSSVKVDGRNTCDECSIYNIKEEAKIISLNFDKININSCENMFKGLNNIKKIDLSGFDSSQVINMAHIFEGCSNFEQIIFGKMDTSKVTNMEYLFYGCSRLQELNLDNFVTSSVTNMRYMFALLFDLTNLKLSENFNSSNVTNMAYMFYYILSLESISLTMFNTSQVSNMSNMFSDAWRLKSLVIPNFDTSKVETIENMFMNCFTLYYLDIYNFKLATSINIEGIFQNKNKNLKFCLNDNVTINYLFCSNNGTLICSDTCISEYNYYIDKVHNQCVDSCDEMLNLDDIFCIDKCPQFSNSFEPQMYPGQTKKFLSNKRICDSISPWKSFFF